jgi:hypothetical protein
MMEALLAFFDQRGHDRIFSDVTYHTSVNGSGGDDGLAASGGPVPCRHRAELDHQLVAPEGLR